MAKFYGVIGYAVTEETKPGVWAEKIIERMYYGDLTPVGFSLRNNSTTTSMLQMRSVS